MTMAEQAPRRIEEAPVSKPKGQRSWVSASDRNVGDPNPGDPLKRPI
jgi:hypothetical protein